MAQWIMNTISAAGYGGIVLLMFVENVFPPIPSELIMPFAGYMAAQQKFSVLGVVIAGTLGSVLGALPLYYAGRLLGEERLRRLVDRHGRWLLLTCDDLDAAKGWFERRGAVAVLLCRMVPGVRSLISIPAGVAGMNMPLFLLLTMLGSAAWSAALAGAGYVLGQRFGQVQAYLDVVAWTVLGGLLLAYVVRAVRIARREG